MTSQQIINTVLQHFGYTFEEVFSKTRQRKYVECRFMIIYFLIDSGVYYSKVDIEKEFKKYSFAFDHSQHNRACNRIIDLCFVDKKIKCIFDNVKKELYEQS